MKTTGIVRRIDELGRIVIPKEVRRTMHIKEGDPLELYLDGTTLCLKKYNTTELFVEALNDLEEMIVDNETSSCLSVEEKVLMKSTIDFLKKRWEEKNEQSNEN